MKVFHSSQAKIVTIIFIMVLVVSQLFCAVVRCNAGTNNSLIIVAEKEDDSKIKAVRAGFRAALKAKNINNAIKYIAEDARDTYKYNFDLLKNNIDDVASNLTDIELDQFLLRR